MGPRRQLGLSISFVDDDAVMGEGKGSPLGIAAIALVGDDAIMREGALDTKKSDAKPSSADELAPATPRTVLTEPLPDSCRALKAGKGRALIIASGLRH